RAAEKVRSRDQFDDRQGAQADDPGIVPIARRRGHRMKRRELIALLGGAAAAWPLAARAQQSGKLRTIGLLSAGSMATGVFAGFDDGLRELGWTDGKNVIIERRFAENRIEAGFGSGISPPQRRRHCWIRNASAARRQA